jgi:hypothetical protein
MAGDNADASVALDLDPATAAVDSETVLRGGSEIWAAAVLDQVVNLDTYSIGLWYDTAALSYVGALENDPGLFGDRVNMLAAHGGQTIGFAVRADRGDDTLEIVNTLVSNNPDEAPEGFGLAALLRFAPRSDSATASIRVAWAELGDVNQIYDQAGGLGSATAILAPQCTLIVAAQGPGTVTPAGALLVACDSAVDLSANALAEGVFVEWVLDGDGSIANGAAAATTVTLSRGSATVTAIFDYATTTVARSVSGAARLTITAGDERIRVPVDARAGDTADWMLVDGRGVVVARRRIDTGRNFRWRIAALAPGAYYVRAAGAPAVRLWTVTR